MMYFLKLFPLDYNVVWKENEPICKKIFLHFKNLERIDEVYESFFERLLEKFGVTDQLKSLEVGSSSNVVDSKKRRAKEFVPPIRKTLKVEEKGKIQVILDILDEEPDREVENPKSMDLKITKPMQEEMETEESEEEDDLTKNKILQSIHEKDGMQKIASIWSIRPSYEQDKISKVLSAYLMHNHVGIEIL
jgi:hypothetical protein